MHITISILLEGRRGLCCAGDSIASSVGYDAHPLRLSLTLMALRSPNDEPNSHGVSHPQSLEIELAGGIALEI